MWPWCCLVQKENEMIWLLPPMMGCCIFCGAFFVEAVVQYRRKEKKLALLAILSSIVYIVLGILMAITIYKVDLGVLSPAP